MSDRFKDFTDDEIFLMGCGVRAYAYEVEKHLANLGSGPEAERLAAPMLNAHQTLERLEQEIMSAGVLRLKQGEVTSWIWSEATEMLKGTRH